MSEAAKDIVSAADMTKSVIDLITALLLITLAAPEAAKKFQQLKKRAARQAAKRINAIPPTKVAVNSAFDDVLFLLLIVCMGALWYFSNRLSLDQSVANCFGLLALIQITRFVFARGAIDRLDVVMLVVLVVLAATVQLAIWVFRLSADEIEVLKSIVHKPR
jgi:hypothetical protein